MTYEWTLYFCLFLSLWSALVGGVLKAFSEFIMKGLLRAEPAGGIESMQHINETVMRTEFVFALVAIGLVSSLFALYAIFEFTGVGRTAIVLAAVIYVFSVFFVTIFGNVPMNERLANMDHKALETSVYWTEYGIVWTRFNHIRTIGAIVTSALYLLAAISLISSQQV